MNTFQIAALSTDIALVGALFYLCFQWAKAPARGAATGRAAQLHSALGNLIGEAETAGKELNNQLQKRQRELEKLLFDLESVENRINRSIEQAEEVRGGLEFEQKKGESILSQLQSAVSGGRERIDTIEARPAPRQQAQPAPQPQVRASQQYPYIEEETVVVQPAPEPPSFDSIQVAESKPQSSYKPLSETVEVEVEPKKHNPVMAQFEDLYAAAEEMLRAGKHIEQVAAKTRIPMSDLQLLARMIATEGYNEEELVDEQEGSTTDPRLSALGQIRRERTVL